MPIFEILSRESVRIGPQKFRCFTHEPPLQGRWHYSIEAAGNDRNAPWTKLSPYHLNNVRPIDLPNGTSISIYQPKSNLRDLSYMMIEKIDDQSFITTTVNFNYPDWHLPVPLHQFLIEYQTIIAQDSDAVESVEISQTEYGLDVICKMRVGSQEDYHVAYDRCCAYILDTYRGALASVFNSQNKSVVKQENSVTDMHGARWWIRYVVVPLLGSATGLALVAGIFALVK